jgi:hypothetical protein
LAARSVRDAEVAGSNPAFPTTQAAFDLANEEAAHAVLRALLGIEILEVRIDRPIQEGPDVAGVVATVPNMDRLYEHLLAVLAGPISVGRDIRWPP